MTTLTTLTAEQTKRVNNDLLDTQRMLNKELAYSKDLQNTTRIAQLEAHIVKLNGMILNGWNAPKFN
jgi:hypothetical protein